MMRNLLAPIEIWDGTIVVDGVQQAQEVFGTIPLRTDDRSQHKKKSYWFEFTKKFCIIGQGLSLSQGVLHSGNLGEQVTEATYLTHLNPQPPRNPNPSQLLSQLIVRQGHNRLNKRHPTSPISSRCEGKGCVLGLTVRPGHLVKPSMHVAKPSKM